MSFPKHIRLVDISTELLNTAKNKLSKYNNIDITTYSDSLHNVDLDIPAKRKGCGIIGIYNADFIEHGLQGYKETVKIVGREFSLCSLSYKNNKLVKNDDMIRFDILEYKRYMDDICKLREQDGFVAYSIQTNNNFVTHYYDSAAILSILHGIYKNVRIEHIGKKHIVIRINSFEPIYTNNGLLTCINNVIGNIPVDIDRVFMVH